MTLPVMHRYRPVLLFMMAVAIAGEAMADVAERLDKAQALAREGNYAPAYCLWLQLAEEGDHEAEFNLGWLYHNGNGVAVDDEQAAIYWERAAKAGHGEAQMALGLLYSQARRDTARRAQAIMWYGSAARQGFHDALLILLDYADDGDQLATRTVAELVQEGKAGTQLRISVRKANVRDRPSTQGKLLMTLSQGSPVSRLDTRGDWLHVWVPSENRVGWMHHSLFE